MKKLKNGDVAEVIFDLTAAAEHRDRSVSALLNTHNRFEGWWQGTLLAGFAAEPWSRRPGWDPEHEESPAGVAMECSWEVGDRRMRYTRQSGRGQKQIDLLVARGRPGSRIHLIELKLLDGGWSLSDPAQVPGVVRDMEALRSMANWKETSSGWAAVLAFGFEKKQEVWSALEPAKGLAIETWIKELDLKDCRTRAWVVGLRAC